jgi:hypothetical protein
MMLRTKRKKGKKVAKFAPTKRTDGGISDPAKTIAIPITKIKHPHAQSVEERSCLPQKTNRSRHPTTTFIRIMTG